MDRAIFVAVGAAIGLLAAGLVIYLGELILKRLISQGLQVDSEAASRRRKRLRLFLVVICVAFGALLGSVLPT